MRSRLRVDGKEAAFGIVKDEARMRYGNTVLAVALAVVLALGGAACSAQKGAEGDQNSTQTNARIGDQLKDQSDGQANDQGNAELDAAYSEALEGKGLVSTFIGSNVYDGTIANEEQARQVMDGLVERIGGDATTELDLRSVIPTETGTTYYIFRQQAGDVLVHGASAKLIVNKGGKATGVVSAILPNVKVPSASEWGVKQEDAERAVVTALEGEGQSGVKVLKDYSAQTVVPLKDGSERYRLAWVVYTVATGKDGDDMPLLANYVSEDGDYLYSIPVSEPDTAEALLGEKIAFDFGAYDQDERMYKVPLHDGGTKEVTVPVLLNKKTGEVEFMGDAKRQILCVDYTQMEQNNTIAPALAQGDDTSFDVNDILVYDSFIRVYDYFDNMGWHGPNDEGTPSLLMMNYMEDGEPGDNCLYMGRADGWESFSFGRVRPYGEALDVIAHEFTHCVTGTTMTTNLYLNEPGAINEGMSDVMGNLVSIGLGDEDGKGAWVIGEKAKEGGMRSMSDPNARAQPRYRWDTFYTPSVTTGTGINDTGGVHINSSLLNIVSYRLHEAGMSETDQLYFWMNVALAMVPTNDYVQMAEILPWVMNQSGYGQYVDVLKKAIDEAGYTKLEEPPTLPAGSGAISFVYPDTEEAEQGHANVSFVRKENPSETLAVTWPAAKTARVSETLPAGDYYVVLSVGESPSNATLKAYTNNGWVPLDVDKDDISAVGSVVHVDEGKTVELNTAGIE